MAYDRMGCQREVFNTAQDPEEPLTTASLFDFSSATVVSAINNSVAKTSRSCWSSDIQERTSFHDSTVTTTAQKPLMWTMTGHQTAIVCRTLRRLR